MSAFLEGLGKVFGKVADQFQGRIERLKNEKAKLLTERHNLLYAKPVPVDFAVRLNKLDERLSEVTALIATKAAD